MPRPLHIAIAGPLASADIDSLLPGRGPWPPGSSGAPLLATQVHELLRRGHRVSVVTLSAGLPLRGHKRPGSRVSVQQGSFSITWCPLRPKVWPWNSTGGAGWLPGRGWDGSRFERQHLRAAISAAQPDLVHAHWAYEYALAALRTGLPHVISCHDLPREVTAEQTLWRNRAFRWQCERMAARVMKRAKFLTAPSPWLAEALAPQARVPVTLLPNALSPGLFGAEPATPAAFLRARSPAGRCRVLMVNNGFGRRKNVGAGLAAFARFAQTRANAELVLIGEEMGPGQAAEQWWRASGLAQQTSRVRFAGALPQATVQHWMRQSDLLLHPALQETFGMVVAEALALGLPVVAGQSSGALPWLVGELAAEASGAMASGGTASGASRGTPGSVASGSVRLCDVRSAETMAAALVQLVDQRDAAPAQAAEQAAAARRAMQARFAAPQVGDTLEALYRGVLADKEA